MSFSCRASIRVLVLSAPRKVSLSFSFHLPVCSSGGCLSGAHLPLAAQFCSFLQDLLWNWQVYVYAAQLRLRRMKIPAIPLQFCHRPFRPLSWWKSSISGLYAGHCSLWQWKLVVSALSSSVIWMCAHSFVLKKNLFPCLFG